MNPPVPLPPYAPDDPAASQQGTFFPGVDAAEFGWRYWLPTNKWWLASIAAAATLATMIWTGDGINTDDERIVLIGLLAQRVLSYVGRN